MLLDQTNLRLQVHKTSTFLLPGKIIVRAQCLFRKRILSRTQPACEGQEFCSCSIFPMPRQPPHHLHPSAACSWRAAGHPPMNFFTAMPKRAPGSQSPLATGKTLGHPPFAAATSLPLRTTPIHCFSCGPGPSWSSPSTPGAQDSTGSSCMSEMLALPGLFLF